MYKLKDNEQEARERLWAFWKQKSIGRPALGVYVKNKDFEWQEWKGEPLPRKEFDLHPEWQANDCRNRLFANKYLAEATPCVCMDYGRTLPLLAVLAGGDYDYDDISPWKQPYGGTTFLLPWIRPSEGALDWNIPKFDPEHETVKGLERNLVKIVETIGGYGFVSPPSMLDALTTLSMLHTPDELCIALYEEPDKVKRWAYDATTLYIDCYEHFYRYLGNLGMTDTSTWLQLLSESRMEAVQCDFSVMLSPDMFEEFVMPDMRRVTSYLDNAVWHHDGVEQFRFIDMIASLPKVRAIQWVFAKREHPSEHIECFKRLKDLGLSLYASMKSVDEAVYLTKTLGSDGLMMTLPLFENEKDAHAAIAEIEKAAK